MDTFPLGITRIVLRLTFNDVSPTPEKRITQWSRLKQSEIVPK